MKLALIAAALACLAAPALAQEAGHVWTVETPKDAEAVLRYGTPDTDDQPVAFFCARKSGQVKVSADLARQLAARQVGEAWVDKSGVREPWPMTIALASQGVTLSLRGKGYANEITSGTTAQGEFSTRAPFVAAFRKSGELTLTAIGETLAPAPAPKGLVRKFLGACK